MICIMKKIFHFEGHLNMNNWFQYCLDLHTIYIACTNRAYVTKSTCPVNHKSCNFYEFPQQKQTMQLNKNISLFFPHVCTSKPPICYRIQFMQKRCNLHDKQLQIIFIHSYNTMASTQNNMWDIRLYSWRKNSPSAESLLGPVSIGCGLVACALVNL